MALGEDNAAEAIAAALGMDAGLLDGVYWTIETIDGNDGEIYGYIVHFDDDTDRNALSALGLAPEEFT